MTTAEPLHAVRAAFQAQAFKLRDIEALLLETALERNDGNITAVGIDLGVSRSSVYRMRCRYGF